MSACVRLAIIAAAMACSAPVLAQTIYPIDRAQVLQGARFDLKVEFPGAPKASDLRVTINGEDASKVLGKEASVIEREDGAARTAYWIRDAALSSVGPVVVEASAGGAATRVTWDVFGTPDGRLARNVILLVGDGLSIAHRTAARMLSKGISQGKYHGDLAMDSMSNMALVSTSGTDSIVTDSANSITAYATGHKSCVNALGVYCASNRLNRQHPRFETIAELAKRRLGLAIGIVTDTEIQDATPSGFVAHTRARSDYEDIVGMYFDLQPDVVLGGGARFFRPAGVDRGKRRDGQDYIEKFQNAGYAFADTATKLADAAAKPETRKLLGLFNDRNIDGALDRRFLKKGTVAKFPDQPDLTESVRAALQVLARNEQGFLLLVEAGRIDKYSHSLDWERAVYDTIMFDNAVAVAKEYAARNSDTLVIVVPDHAHPVSIIGTYDDRKGDELRQRLQTYASAGFPDYPEPDAAGYPPRVDVARRLAMVFAAYPDHCDAGRPYLDGENVPAPAAAPAANAATQADEKTAATSNPTYCPPGAARKIGNLPITARSGVHAADDVLLTADGPGADAFSGRVDNTYVFRAMARALGLAK